MGLEVTGLVLGYRRETGVLIYTKSVGVTGRTRGEQPHSRLRWLRAFRHGMDMRRFGRDTTLIAATEYFVTYHGP